NNAPRWAAERVEGRAVTKGNRRHVTRTGRRAGRACPRRRRLYGQPAVGPLSVVQGSLPSRTQGRSRMGEGLTSGSVRGVPGNRHSYCDKVSHRLPLIRVADAEKKAGLSLTECGPCAWRFFL